MHPGRYQKAILTTTLLLGQCFWLGQARAIAELPTFVEVTIVSSMETALWAESPGEGRALAAEVARLWRRPCHRGDQLALLFVAKPAAGEPLLQAMRYRGRSCRNCNEGLEAYRFTGEDGIARYYDDGGRRIEPVMRNPPVPRYEQITERVQRGRGRRRHAGDDLKAALGSPVVLPFAGSVQRTNWHKRRNGLCVEVLLDAGYTARFLHLSKIEPSVQRGVHLAAGAKLGEVGSTGHSTGPHLHYELLQGQRPIEPLSVHGREQAALSGDALARFILVRDALRRQLAGPTTMPVGAPPPAVTLAR